MATDRQTAANRRNGALSRGPKTAAGKARSSRNALKHGLAIPITRDHATARKIRRAARQMAPSAVGDSIRNAQIAAEANFELARVRAAFEAVVARMSISHTSNAGPGNTCGTGSGKSAAPIGTLAELDKLDRYECRASQDEGERYGISEPHGYAKAYVLLRKVEIGFVLPY
jgi:hypothetical protein